VKKELTTETQRRDKTEVRRQKSAGMGIDAGVDL
jgi:hypothetical protein